MRQVIFHARARIDVATTISWLARSNPEAANRWRIGLLRIVENLETNPERYPIADEAADLGLDLRQLLYGRRRQVYRVLFTIDGQKVNVLRVRHAAQDRLAPEDID